MTHDSTPSETTFQRIRRARWQGMTAIGIAFSILVGIALGQSAYTFHYGEGLSYFSPDPKACVNCHIMQPQYDGWQKASHHTVAKCVDCHLPHDFVGKYLAKADNGYRHSKAFTFQNFPEPIEMIERSRRILQHNCVDCHEAFVHDVLTWRNEHQELDCIHCHRTVGHGDTVGMGRIEPVSAEIRKAFGP